MGADQSRTDLRTHYFNSQPIVLEVSKSACLTLEKLHFGVEAFGDSVVVGEAPHRHDLLRPGGQGLADSTSRISYDSERERCNVKEGIW